MSQDELKWYVIKNGKIYRRLKMCSKCEGEWEYCPACGGRGSVDITKKDSTDNSVPELWVEQQGH